MNFVRIYDWLFRALLVLLPVNVLITVFFQYRLGVPGFGMYKEALIVILSCMLIGAYVRKGERPKVDFLDGAILSYVAIFLAVSLFNGIPVKEIAYGARYDFEFLFAFLLAKHSMSVLPGHVKDYLRLFLLSATVAVLLSILVRFVFKETSLVYLGYSASLSNWSFGGAPPIYHGIEGANVRRFQGIFDGPNSAAYFLIAYLGLAFHYFRNRKDELFLVSVGALVVFGLIFLTYSRSSVIGIIVATAVLLLTQIGPILRKHKAAFIISGVFVAVLSYLFFVSYRDVFDRIIFREGSSKWHFERSVGWIHRFMDMPFGQWLSAAGPAYRYTEDAKRFSDEKSRDDYGITESWFIQQFVEGGAIGWTAFLVVAWAFAWAVFSVSLPLFWSFTAVLAMNVFLHTYESTYVSLFLFMAIGLVLGQRAVSQHRLPRLFIQKAWK